MLPKPMNTTTQQQSLASDNSHILSIPQFMVDPKLSPQPGNQIGRATSHTAIQPHQTDPGHEKTHTFKRLQFRYATTKLSQRYFHLIAELLVDLRHQDTDQPVWHVIANRTSANIVVRGCNPSYHERKGGAISTGRQRTRTAGAYGRVAGGIMKNMDYENRGQDHMRSPGMRSTACTGCIAITCQTCGQTLPLDQWPTHVNNHGCYFCHVRGSGRVVEEEDTIDRGMLLNFQQCFERPESVPPHICSTKESNIFHGMIDPELSDVAFVEPLHLRQDPSDVHRSPELRTEPPSCVIPETTQVVDVKTHASLDTNARKVANSGSPLMQPMFRRRISRACDQCNRARTKCTGRHPLPALRKNWRNLRRHARAPKWRRSFNKRHHSATTCYGSEEKYQSEVH